MARRKNVKRIDPRYFLNETVDRDDDGYIPGPGKPDFGGPSGRPGPMGVQGFQPTFERWAQKYPGAAKTLALLGLPQRDLAAALDLVLLGMDDTNQPPRDEWFRSTRSADQKITEK